MEQDLGSHADEFFKMYGTMQSKIFLNSLDVLTMYGDPALSQRELKHFERIPDRFRGSSIDTKPWQAALTGAVQKVFPVEPNKVHVGRWMHMGRICRTVRALFPSLELPIQTIPDESIKSAVESIQKDIADKSNWPAWWHEKFPVGWGVKENETPEAFIEALPINESQKQRLIQQLTTSAL